MTDQKKILIKLAKNHGLTIGQAEEIWKLLMSKVVTTISNPDKKGEDGLYDYTKFSTIHIDNFGKFIPNLRNIRHANMCIKQKKMIKISLENNNWIIKKSNKIETYLASDVQLSMQDCTLKNNDSELWIECDAIMVSGKIGIKLDSTVIKHNEKNWVFENNTIINNKKIKSIVSLGTILFMS